LARTVRITKYLRDIDPSTIGPHANALLETIKKSLNFDKLNFCKFIQGMHSITAYGGVLPHEKAKQLTIRSALLQGSLKFTAAQVVVMDIAYRLGKIDRDLDEEKVTYEQISALKSLLKSLEPRPINPAPSSVPSGKSGLVLVSPDNSLSDEQISRFQERLDSRKIDHVYFIGTDEGFGDFKSRYSNLSSLHVTTKDELKSVIKSSSVSTLRLSSQNIEHESNFIL
jgi:hypothetical protein